MLAGAGTGKTRTLAAFAAHRTTLGIDPRRILVLAFNWTAAREIEQRIRTMVRTDTRRSKHVHPQCDTFHAAALRFVQRYASRLGLEPNFTIQDRTGSILLMESVLAQQEIGNENGFPEAEECLKIYSLRVNTLASLKATLSGQRGKHLPFRKILAESFRAYDQAKRRNNVVDFDDLLILWDRLLQHSRIGDRIRALFDYVLVDEYQDTTPLQERILNGLRPEGRGLVLVGDDDQCIYGFRGASPKHILDRAKSAKVLKLTQSHRSPQSILDACNAVICGVRPTSKTLWSKDKTGSKATISVVSNERAQVRRVVQWIGEAQAQGVHLRDQAVLSRTAEETQHLETELKRLGVPYRKVGGNHLLNHAGFKTVLAILSWCENPRDTVVGAVAFQAIPGIDPSAAFRVASSLHGGLDRRGLIACRPPVVRKRLWSAFVDLVVSLDDLSWDRQVPTICRWLREYGSGDALGPKVARKLDRLAVQYRARSEFLAAANLQRAADTIGPLAKTDRLTISTIHSAKGQEWTAVCIMNAVDGCIPFRLASCREEERRLLFVGMTRAKRRLELLVPKRLRQVGTGRTGLARTPFISKRTLPLFETK